MKAAREAARAKINEIIVNLKREPATFDYLHALADFINANPNAADFIRQAWKDALNE